MLRRGMINTIDQDDKVGDMYVYSYFFLFHIFFDKDELCELIHKFPNDTVYHIYVHRQEYFGTL